MQLLIATKNPAKKEEMARFLGNDFELVFLPADAPEVEETGTTFEENANLKARAYFDRYHIACVADDGGLKIRALNDEPGVYSRRWPQEHEELPYREKTDKELIDMAVDSLKGLYRDDRAACLYTAVAYYDGTRMLTASAQIAGRIAHAKPAPGQWKPGYPFRSIFRVDRFGELYRDLTPEQHDAVNHRREAFEKLRQLILNT